MFHVKQDALAQERFRVYARYLLEENQKYNLTAITEEEDVIQKHFIDSLMPLDWLRPPEGSTLLDVGSGAGFPGMALAIARPGLAVTLLDSTEKKAAFLRRLAELLDLPVRVICARAESAAREDSLREGFDFVTARAVAALPALCEYCLPFVRVGGVFCAWKGLNLETETALAANAIEVMGGRLAHIHQKSMSYGERGAVLIDKISHTPSKYPRNTALILKKPL
ncbi:MAG: 16S rRNA (guanine(527)-N(7))-methyltransferase RsmG [Oscillospiraceae bacterium]|nr:16S rRNA (guanine(527)-N(7))-methyltransferase RsmG [Oscillospiraceae bacterium]